MAFVKMAIIAKRNMWIWNVRMLTVIIKIVKDVIHESAGFTICMVDVNSWNIAVTNC